MKKKVKAGIAWLLVIGMVSGCGGQKIPQESSQTMTEETEQADAEDTKSQAWEEPVKGEPDKAEVGSRPALVFSRAEEEISPIPGVERYTIEPDMSNIDNRWQFYMDEKTEAKLVQNGFVVYEGGGSEFFETYEENRYNQVANFVTVDSLMHTYHLYFSYLLRNMERTYLSDNMIQLSRRMLQNSTEQYDRLKGSEWEAAAIRNVAFFAVGTGLLGDDVTVGEEAKEIADYELEHIHKAEGIAKSAITGELEDYTQYIPRGYYEGDRQLENYFKAMMWYGRIHFNQEWEELNRSALLISEALWDDAEAYRLWEAVYAVTSFFAGASDDLGVCEYIPAICSVYGEHMSVEDLPGNQAAFERFCTEISALPKPQINSIPIWEGEEQAILGFRFMGQRFTIDGAIMQKLIDSFVKQNSQGEKRMLPDVLDVPAALGSDMALTILQLQGDTDYQGYLENMERLRSSLSTDNAELWSASLYAGWLHTLRPLLTPKGDGYPVFMQNTEWVKKDLECFAGSFAELKHDTILYSKQVIAEMGGGWEEEPDDRGYVEPEPVVFARFAALASGTAQGLERYGMLGVEEKENLYRLSEMASRLLTISQKELQEEELTEEEYEFIRSYGGNIEHFWYEALKKESTSEEIISQEYPAAIVADIATNPDQGQVLEVATGNPSRILVVVKVDGKVKLASGSVYTFYQFEWPADDRLTDSKWRQMIGLQCDENGEYHFDKTVKQPKWTASYRYVYTWE